MGLQIRKSECHQTLRKDEICLFFQTLVFSDPEIVYVVPPSHSTSTEKDLIAVNAVSDWWASGFRLLEGGKTLPLCGE